MPDHGIFEKVEIYGAVPGFIIRRTPGREAKLSKAIGIRNWRSIQLLKAPRAFLSTAGWKM